MAASWASAAGGILRVLHSLIDERRHQSDLRSRSASSASSIVSTLPLHFFSILFFNVKVEEGRREQGPAPRILKDKTHYKIYEYRNTR